MTSKLSLKKERLAELTTDELHGVAAGAPDQATRICISALGGGCHSWEACTTAISCSCPPTYTCA